MGVLSFVDMDKIVGSGLILATVSFPGNTCLPTRHDVLHLAA